jgi:hypothetical protein
MGIEDAGLVRVAGLVVLLVAAVATSAVGGQPNALEAGSWALQFRITNNFNLAAFESGQLTIKRQFTTNSAVRAGISLGLSDTDETDEGGYTDDTGATGVGISILYQRYLRPDRRGRFYWGIGPVLEISSGESERRNEEILTQRTTVDGWELGVCGVAGVEWFATRAISLHAEYRGALSRLQTTIKREIFYQGADPVKTEFKVEKWDFAESGAVLFGVSVYF